MFGFLDTGELRTAIFDHRRHTTGRNPAREAGAPGDLTLRKTVQVVLVRRYVWYRTYAT